MIRKRVSGKKGWGLAAVLLLTTFLAACSDQGAAGQGGAEDGRLNVVTTIAQIAEPVSVIGGDRITVQSLMGPGVDPHLFKASQGDINKLQGADIILYSGLHLEANMLRAFEQIGKSRPVLAIGDTLPEENLLKDENGATDPHIWFDIDLWKQALRAATEQLQEASPEDADYFEANMTAYFAEMDAFKAEAVAQIAQIPEDRRVLVTAHDAFGYFGRMLGLEVVGLQGLSTEAEIGLSDIDQTVALLLEHQVPAVFVESSINPASINAVIEGAKEKGLDLKLGGELFSDAMGAAGTEEGTYLGMYRHNVETISHALK